LRRHFYCSQSGQQNFFVVASAIIVDIVMEADGFTQLHVSGLPADCEDADVEAALRRALSKRQLEGPSTSTESSIGGTAANAVEAATDVDTKVTGECRKTPEIVAEEAEESQALQKPKEAEKPLETAAEEAGQLPRGTENTAASNGDSPQQEVVQFSVQGDAPFDADLFTSCVVVRNKDTNVCKGYCFLGFHSLKTAEEAMLVINAGVTVAGSQVQAQISQPKQKHAKKKESNDDLGDLRLRRQRYPAASKKAMRGHVTCSDTSANVTAKTGRINASAGTRGGKQLRAFNKLEGK